MITDSIFFQNYWVNLKIIFFLYDFIKDWMNCHLERHSQVAIDVMKHHYKKELREKGFI